MKKSLILSLFASAMVATSVNAASVRPTMIAQINGSACTAAGAVCRVSNAAPSSTTAAPAATSIEDAWEEIIAEYRYDITPSYYSAGIPDGMTGAVIAGGLGARTSERAHFLFAPPTLLRAFVSEVDVETFDTPVPPAAPIMVLGLGVMAAFARRKRKLAVS